jgi:SprT protein
MNSPDHNEPIEPIDARHQQRVRDATHEYIARAGRIYEREIPPITVTFDLKGRAAGMYRVHNQSRLIRYNPYIFAKYFDDNLATTVPHEVAHYVVDVIYRAGRVRPHGVEWQRVMQSLGAEPRVTGDYDLSGVPVRRQKRYSYRCGCMTHQISSARHNRMLRNKARYYCRRCRSALAPVQEKEK